MFLANVMFFFFMTPLVSLFISFFVGIGDSKNALSSYYIISSDLMRLNFMLSFYNCDLGVEM